MEKICCIVLAAGMGKRLGGEVPKALAKTRERALVDHVLGALEQLNPEKTIVVTGYKRDLLESHLSSSPEAARHKIEFALQSEQLGTGHAVQCALPALAGFTGTVIITYADQPLFTAETLQHLVSYHTFKKATLSMITFHCPTRNSYGRIVRDKASGAIVCIREAKDCNPEELLIPEVNSGVYAIDSSFLTPAVTGLTNDNAQKEFYLTDIVEKAAKEGQTVAAFPIADSSEAAGVNNASDLHFVNKILAERQISRLTETGVLFDDAASSCIDPTVTIAPGVRIGPNVQLLGNTSIAAGARIEGTSLIKDSTIGEHVSIKLGCRIEGATIGAQSSVGPFAHLRPGTSLATEVKIGNFVETKNAVLADGAKASHLTYLGDCTVGRGTNIGAGTITCNYDGYKKSRTTIGEGVFIGSNSALVAPVTIGDNALVAAGSVITRDVQPEALAMGRAKQENKEGWAGRRRKVLEQR
jgi:bifunctional UDP-N-acetylglucosamine pyrophosphorylase/glucosamine-1-phosphate N-acetyltransferase